jgi:CheY-like chemotaxis protein
MTQRFNRKFSVLIADDSEEDRFLLRSAIANHAPHFEVVGEVDSGDHLIQYLTGKGDYANREGHPFPDLLFLDLRMPGKDGFEVLEWLQTHNFPRLKIAVLTDSAGLAYRAEALTHGADYFFHKSVSPDELGLTVKKLQDEMLAVTKAVNG